MSLPNANENAFLGSLLGVAIGDALGLPVTGLEAGQIREHYGELTGYLPGPGQEAGDPNTGEISDKTDVVLSIVESLTANDGLLDPENITARLGFLITGNARATMSDAVVNGIEDASARDGLVSEEVVSEPEPAVAARGVPVGLLHAVGAYDATELARDAEIVTRLTHGGEAAARLTARVAQVVAAAARFGGDVTRWTEIKLGDADEPLEERVDAMSEVVRTAETFEDAVLAVVREGGEASAWGAIAGGIAGARFGASGIPQQLIDDLDARIYLSMAAPWFYRTVMRRAGTIIDLRVIE